MSNQKKKGKTGSVRQSAVIQTLEKKRSKKTGHRGIILKKDGILIADCLTIGGS